MAELTSHLSMQERGCFCLPDVGAALFISSFISRAI